MDGHLTILAKKDYLTYCDNYRGIMLSFVPGKVLSDIILISLKAAIDKKKRNNQAGRSYSGQIISLRIIIEQFLEMIHPPKSI